MNHPNFTDENYKKHIKQLIKVDNIYNGIDTAVEYINQFAKESPETYQARKSEATLDNYVFRTIEAIKNIVFRKSIDTSAIKNKELLKWLDKANLQDNINEFAKKILVNRVKDGYTYILIDSPAYDKNKIVSKADLEANNIRPYFSNILRKQVINIEYNEFMMIRQVSIMETYKEKVGRFGYKTKEQIRVFELVDGSVEVSIWRDEEEVSNDILTIPIIPLVKVGKDDTPPLYDQTIINVNHLNRNSEKSNYVRVGAAPFPLIWGMPETNSKTTLGINDGIHFQGNKNESGFEWAEMSGNNYKIIQEEIKYREEQMERISVEFVTQLKNATATEVEKASTSNESKLMDYATELEHGINTAIQMISLFYPNISEEDKIIVNKDFDSNILTGQEVETLIKLRVNGDLSWERLMGILERGEVLEMMNEEDREREKTLIKDDVGVI